MPESNLLAYLAICCHVDYISDLKLTPNCKKVISKIETNSFPLHEWIDAVHYLCRTNQSFESVEKAKEYLLNQQS